MQRVARFGIGILCPVENPINNYLRRASCTECFVFISEKWKRRSVGAPSRDVPSLSLFQTKSRSDSHFPWHHDFKWCTSHGSDVRALTDRQMHTHTHTQMHWRDQFFYPRPLTGEGKEKMVCLQTNFVFRPFQIISLKQRYNLLRLSLFIFQSENKNCSNVLGFLTIS